MSTNYTLKNVNADGTGAWTSVPLTSVTVSSMADLPAPVDGVITLTDNTAYVINGTVDIGTNRIVCGIKNTFTGVDRQNDILTSSTPDVMFTMDNSVVSKVTFIFDNLTLKATAGTLISAFGGATPNQVTFISTTITATPYGGTFSNIVFSMRTSSLTSFSVNGFVFSGANTAMTFRDSSATNNIGTVFDCTTATFSQVRISRNSIMAGAGGVFLNATGMVLTTSASFALNSLSGASTTHLVGVDGQTANWRFIANFGAADTLLPISGTTGLQAALDAKLTGTYPGGTATFLRGDGSFAAPPSSATAWGDITGTLSNQTDLQTALNGKQVAGSYATGTGTANGTNTGDQTSIVGITGTIAQFNTACTDADFATGGGNATGTNTGDQTSVSGNAGTATVLQTARNINGVSFNGSADITVTAAAGTLTGATLASGVTASSLTSVGTLTNLAVTNPITGSVTGNAATVTTNANLTGEVTSVGNATTIANDAVTFAKMQNIATAKLLGRGTGGTGDVEEITLGTNLSFTGTTLNAAGGGGGGGGNFGSATIDFGAFPGTSDTSVAVTGQASISAGSKVMAWIFPAATADHSADEHWLESIRVFAGNVIAGTGFTLYARNDSTLNEPITEPRLSRFLGAGQDAGGGQQGRQSYANGGSGTRIYGTWNVGWQWG